MNSKNKLIKDRSMGIDVIKAMAILFVVGVHFFINTYFYSTNLNSCSLISQLFLQQLFLTCIPLFLMATGYLNNHISIDIRYFKKIIPVMLVYVFYSILALIYRYRIGNVEFDILLWIELILTFKANTYSWYVNLYFGLFLLIPFLNRMYFSLESKKEKQILIFILALLSVTSPILLVPDFWAKLYPLAYFFIGKYFKEFKPRLSKAKNIIYLLLVIIVQVIIEYAFAAGGKYAKFINHYSIFRAIGAYLLFSLLYGVKISNPILKRMTLDISNLTLDIYLASYLTDKIIYKYIKELPLNQEQFFYLFIPLVLASFLIAFTIGKLRLNIKNIFKFSRNDKISFKTNERVA